jgi:hypothetical protein
VQAKFGQYLQNAKEPRSISQTEKAVEWEQVSSKEQVLPMPDLKSASYMPKTSEQIKIRYVLKLCSKTATRLGKSK